MASGKVLGRSSHPPEASLRGALLRPSATLLLPFSGSLAGPPFLVVQRVFDVALAVVVALVAGEWAYSLHLMPSLPSVTSPDLAIALTLRQEGLPSSSFDDSSV